MDPDEYDRLMGISSVSLSEEDKLGDGEVADTEELGERVANDSIASRPTISGSGSCPGADVDSRGYGSASLIECLSLNLSRVPSLATPAACASE